MWSQNRYFQLKSVKKNIIELIDPMLSTMYNSSYHNLISKISDDRNFAFSAVHIDITITPYHDFAYSIIMNATEYNSDFELTKVSSYLAFKGELLCFILRILEKIDCIIMALHCIHK